MNIQIKDGVVTNDGNEIGSIQGDVCFLLAKVGPTVKGAIKKVSGLEALAFVAQAVEPEDEPEATTATFPHQSLETMSDDALAAEMLRRGLTKNEPEPPAIVQPPVKQIDLSAVERLHKLAGEGKISHPPVKHPAMGDKDPAYVAWFKTYATADEIAIRYPENRRVPASTAEFAKAEEKLRGKLPGEKKDTNKENDFNDAKEAE